MESQGFVGLKAGQKDGGLGHKRPRWVNALGGREAAVPHNKPR